jgi:uncharacterized protein (DUF983 family)
MGCGRDGGTLRRPAPTTTDFPPVSPYLAGLRCRCPRCGQGRLFSGYVDLVKRCDVCGLDYRFADAGDGPAVFVILIAGFLVVGLAVVVEFVWRPPYWVHALLWTPAVLFVTLGMLRPLKGVLVALQFHHKAAEGRLDKSGRSKGGRPKASGKGGR